MRLSEMAERVTAMHDDASDAGLASAENLARELGHPATVCSILDSVLADERLLASVASRSFRHTNHFDKIVLLGEEARASYRVALNLWRPPFAAHEVEDEQIHDHRCDFWSTILFGSLRSTEFERHEAGMAYTEFRYRAARPEGGAKRNEYRVVGTSRLRHSGDIERSIATTYHLPRERIHRIVISQEPTATLLLRGPYRVDETSIFTTRRPYVDVDLPSLDVDELREDLDFIRRKTK